MVDQDPDRLNTSLVVELRPDALSRVRNFLAENLKLDSVRTAEAALLVTEIVTNSIRQGQARAVTVSIVSKAPLARVSVACLADQGTGELTPEGSVILDKVARSWGSFNDEGTLTVWFEVRSPGTISTSTEDQDDIHLLAGVAENSLYVDELVRRYQSRAVSIAQRYRGWGVPSEDLEQVALMALLKAIHRFDPSRGTLESYAAVTVSGELKRHLRDRGWSVHVPRGLKERMVTVARTAEELTQRTGRVPSISEIAAAIDGLDHDVAEALSVAHGYAALSLDSPLDGGSALSDILSGLDDSLADAARRDSVAKALLSLPARERLIVYLRFYEDLTQSQVAARVGVSQMHVSRLLANSLSILGDILDSDM